MAIYLFSKTPHHEVFHIPIIKTYYINKEIDFTHYDALVITSKESIYSLESSNPDWVNLPILAISSATADEAKKYGAYILGTGDGYGDSLTEKILKHRVYRWLYVRPQVVASDFVKDVKDLGGKIEEKIIYETSCNKSLKSQNIPIDATLIFTSPSAVKCFLASYDFLQNQNIIVIGKTTAQALPHFAHYHISPKPTVEACIELAKEYERI
ncbi:MAG: uroporphyrinogen-III synthase [Campylobacterota bacterium]|nr:uroporphyrinogen-III synthase [Campylobacterota bacterium]